MMVAARLRKVKVRAVFFLKNGKMTRKNRKKIDGRMGKSKSGENWTRNFLREKTENLRADGCAKNFFAQQKKCANS